MDQRVQYWRMLTKYLLIIVFFSVAPKIVDILFPFPSSEPATATSPTVNNLFESNDINLSLINYADLIKNSLELARGVALTLGTLGVIYAGFRLVFMAFFNGDNGSRDSNYEGIYERLRREDTQSQRPNVADALEDLLVSQNDPTQQESEQRRSEQRQQGSTEVIQSSSYYTRVIRETDYDHQVITDEENVGEVKRVIRS